LFETNRWYNVVVLIVRVNAPAPSVDALDAFKARTLGKLRDVYCPVHRRAPRVTFEGRSLRDVRLSVSSCCDLLSRLANKAIAS
jgi:hypothetical protein